MNEIYWSIRRGAHWQGGAPLSAPALGYTCWVGRKSDLLEEEPQHSLGCAKGSTKETSTSQLSQSPRQPLWTKIHFHFFDFTIYLLVIALTLPFTTHTCTYFTQITKLVVKDQTSWATTWPFYLPFLTLEKCAVGNVQMTATTTTRLME